MLFNLFAGILIGIGFIIPGVSGGVIAVILGVYEKIINSFLNLKRENLKFLFSISLGAIIGIYLFSNILLKLLKYRELPLKFCFMGLISGGIIYLLKELKLKTNKNLNFCYFVGALLISISLFFIERQEVKFDFNTNYSFYYLIIVGLAYAIGKIVPGISGAALLMLLGVYETFLNFVANPLSLDKILLIKLLPFLGSFCFFSLLILKLINILLKKYYLQTSSAVIGFTSGSLLYIFPGFYHYRISNLVLILIFLLSFFLSYLLIKKRA